VSGITFDHLVDWWQDKRHPITGPAFPGWQAIDAIAVHYRGVGPLPVPLDIAQHLRNTDAFYRTKGYSIAYQVGIVSAIGHPLDGHVIELRGTRFQSAATKGANHHTFAVLFIILDNAPASPKAIAAMQRLVAEAEAAKGAPLAIRPHSYYRPTACPGTGLHAQIAAGVFRPPAPAPTPEPAPPTEDDDMPRLWLATESTTGKVWASNGVTRWHVPNTDALNVMILRSVQGHGPKLYLANGAEVRGAGEVTAYQPPLSVIASMGAVA
jgi:hypothetical protein